MTLQVWRIFIHIIRTFRVVAVQASYGSLSVGLAFGISKREVPRRRMGTAGHRIDRVLANLREGAIKQIFAVGQGGCVHNFERLAPICSARNNPVEPDLPAGPYGRHAGTHNFRPSATLSCHAGDGDRDAAWNDCTTTGPHRDSTSAWIAADPSAISKWNAAGAVRAKLRRHPWHNLATRLWKRSRTVSLAATLITLSQMTFVAAQSVSKGAVPEETALVVRLVRAELRPDRQTVSLTGYIAARKTLMAAFSNAGRVGLISVIEGDRVKKGDELARIESVAQEQALRSKEAGLASAVAGLTQAQSDFTRNDALLARGATTRTVRDTAENVLIAAEATVAEAQAELDLARKDLDETVLRSPADAIVTSRDAEVGQVVAAAEGVIGLAIGAEFDAVIGVPEVRLSVPRNPVDVQLALLGSTSSPFRGKVREISPVVDTKTGTVQVKIGVIDPPKEIAIGAAVQAMVEYIEAPIIALPFSSLTATASGPAVWVVDPASFTVKLRQVEILRHESGKVIIRSGLQDGQIIVGAGSQLLYEGRLVKDAGPTNEMNQ